MLFECRLDLVPDFVNAAFPCSCANSALQCHRLSTVCDLKYPHQFRMLCKESLAGHPGWSSSESALHCQLGANLSFSNGLMVQRLQITSLISVALPRFFHWRFGVSKEQRLLYRHIQSSPLFCWLSPIHYGRR
jgi:hypothetical protein